MKSNEFITEAPRSPVRQAMRDVLADLNLVDAEMWSDTRKNARRIKAFITYPNTGSGFVRPRNEDLPSQQKVEKLVAKHFADFEVTNITIRGINPAKFVNFPSISVTYTV